MTMPQEGYDPMEYPVVWVKKGGGFSAEETPQPIVGYTRPPMSAKNYDVETSFRQTAGSSMCGNRREAPDHRRLGDGWCREEGVRVG